MKNFFSGLAMGVALSGLAVAIVLPQFSDYRAAAETSAWLAEIQSTQAAIAHKAKQAGSLESAGLGVAKPASKTDLPDHIEITNGGEIFLKGGRDGQLIVLRPRLEGENVLWQCIGGSHKATLSCR